MPLCVLRSNLTRNKFSADFERSFPFLVSRVLEKPPEKVILVLDLESPINRGGDPKDDVVWLRIESINKFNKEDNPQFAKQLKDHLSEELSVDRTKILVTLHDLPAHALY